MTGFINLNILAILACFLTLVGIACDDTEAKPSQRAANGLGGAQSVGSNDSPGSGGRSSLVGGDEAEKENEACEDVVCDEGFVCVASAGAAQCDCNSEECEEVEDFCSAAPCDSNAACTALESGYKCECSAGFSGSGFSCTPGDLCDTYLCGGKNTACSSDGFNAVCACLSGFELSPNGLDCSDIDECSATDVCAFGSECLNRPASFSCDCVAGYEASGDDTCVDTTECAQANDCSALGMSCVELEGGYQCSCSASEVTDGTFCKSPASCTPSSCNSNGNCVEASSGSLCSCDLGFVGNSCSDEITCAADLVLNSLVDPVINDSIIRAAVEELLGLEPATEFTVSDLANFSELFIPPPSGVADQVTSLDGLNCFSNLTSLKIAGHGVSDLSPLATLYQLEALDLSCNPITDLGEISSLRFLKDLSLSQVGPCLTAGAQFTSLSGKIDSFVDLQVLDVEELGLTTLSGFNELVRLRELYLAGNAVSPVTDLTSLTSLISLNAARTAESSLSGLPNFLSLRSLNLSGAAISSLVGLKDAPQLRSFVANDSGLSSLAGAGEALLLTELRLNQNNLTTIAGLKASSSLVSVGLIGNQIESLDDLIIDSELKLNATVDLRDNELDCTSSFDAVSKLAAAGVVVEAGCP